MTVLYVAAIELLNLVPSAIMNITAIQPPNLGPPTILNDIAAEPSDSVAFTVLDVVTIDLDLGHCRSPSLCPLLQVAAYNQTAPLLAGFVLAPQRGL
jgi:hypothetical protein